MEKAFNQYFKTKFPQTSDTKLKEGIFIGPQIRKLMKDASFNVKLNRAERRAWASF